MTTTLKASAGGVGAQISCWAWVGSYRCLSDNAPGHRHAQPGHPVQRRAADPGLGLLGGQSPSAEAATDEGLITRHGPLPQRSSAVSSRFFSPHAPTDADQLDMAVPLRG